MTVIGIHSGLMEDLLFWPTLGRVLAAGANSSGPVMIVHALGEITERTIEGLGHVPSRPRALLVGTDHGAPALVRGAREENRSIVSALTDEGLSAVGFLGLDRALFRWEAEELQPGRQSWIVRLADSGAIPVLGAIAESSPAGVREWPLGLGMACLCSSEDTAVLLSTAKAIPEDPISESDAQNLVPEAIGLGTLLDHGVSVRISEVSALLSGGPERAGEVYRSR